MLPRSLGCPSCWAGKSVKSGSTSLTNCGESSDNHSVKIHSEMQFLSFWLRKTISRKRNSFESLNLRSVSKRGWILFKYGPLWVFFQVHLMILFISSPLLTDSEWCLTECNRDRRYNHKNGQGDAILSSKDLCLFLSFYLAPWRGQLIELITF